MTNALLIALALLPLLESPTGKAGDAGLGRGCYQLHKAYVQDAVRISGVPFSWPRDAENPARARGIVEIYLSHYGRELYGNHPTVLQYRRLHKLGATKIRKERGGK